MPHPLVLSHAALASDDDTKVVFSCVSYGTVVLEEGGSESDLHDAVLRIRAIEIFGQQVSNGGFSQFVYNTAWGDDLRLWVGEGLEWIGATEHLAYFRAQSAKVEAVRAEGRLDEFLDGSYFGKNPVRDELNDRSYFDIDADLVALSAAWLRNHPDVVPHTIDEMFERAEGIVGHPISRT